MTDFRNRKRDDCMTYRREGRTKQNMYECTPPTPECLGGGEKGFRRDGRTKRNMYECCPPTPVELGCSVCRTAERDGCNLWNCVPFVSYSTLYGPTLADILVHLLNLLPLSFLACLGIAHPRCCSAQPSPPLIKCDPVSTTPMNQKRTQGCADKKPQKRPCPCPKLNPEVTNDWGDGQGDSGGDSLSGWMHDEYEALARELADLKRLTYDEEQPGESDNRDLLQARNYVLDRLAEMLAKREEIEKRIKKKKQNR